MKKITIITIFSIALLTTQCKKAIDSDFLITNTSVGQLTTTHSATDLATLFAKDSIVAINGSLLGATKGKQQVFEKGGKPLLRISIATDKKIENIQILDPRYKTDTGVGLLSTFKDIKDSYTIDKVMTSTNNVVLFIKDSNIYFTIDKKELPAALRYNTKVKIEAVQIPDAAKIKYLMLGWE